MLPALRGLGMVMYDNVYVVAWNTKFVKADDAPRQIRDFADPKWRGKFAINVLGGAPFDLLGLKMGEGPMLDLVRALLANRSPEGIFWDWPGDTEVVMARKSG